MQKQKGIEGEGSHRLLELVTCNHEGQWLVITSRRAALCSLALKRTIDFYQKRNIKNEVVQTHTWVVSLPRGDCLSHRGTFWIIYSDHWKFWSALGVSVQCHDFGASALPWYLLNRCWNSAPGLLWHFVWMLYQAQGPAGARSRASPWLVVLQQYLHWPPRAPSQRPAFVLPSAASSLAPCLPCSVG